jgi:hypothetical protein
MDMRAIRVGDVVEVDIRGYVFPATVRSKAPRTIGIDPADPIRFTYRFCSSRQVKKRISRPESEGAVV